MNEGKEEILIYSLGLRARQYRVMQNLGQDPKAFWKKFNLRDHPYCLSAFYLQLHESYLSQHVFLNQDNKALPPPFLCALSHFLTLKCRSYSCLRHLGAFGEISREGLRQDFEQERVIAYHGTCKVTYLSMKEA